jgi:hypothetical protein
VWLLLLLLLLLLQQYLLWGLLQLPGCRVQLLLPLTYSRFRKAPLLPICSLLLLLPGLGLL